MARQPEQQGDDQGDRDEEFEEGFDSLEVRVRTTHMTNIAIADRDMNRGSPALRLAPLLPPSYLVARPASDSSLTESADGL